MEESKGGTTMYCPNCRALAKCAAVPTTQVGLPSGQRWHRTDHVDVQWFRRGRECQSCKHTFSTAEVQEQFLDELVELRNALAAIKSNAEAYAREAQAASASLAKLTASLGVLRALDLYKAVQPVGVTPDDKGEAEF